jgi:predicted amidophosphoribosyltransferase
MARRTYRLHRRCPSVEGATVLLVDDVITTGATMLAGIELLQAAGAKKIYCLTVGQTIKSSSKGKK